MATVTRLPTEEVIARGGATHKVVVTVDELSESATGTAEAVALLTPASNERVECLGIGVTTGLADASDSGHDDVTAQVGDSGDPDRLAAAAQVAANGSVVVAAPGTGTSRVYDGATAVNLTITPKTGKANDQLDSGELVVWLKITDLAA